MTMSLGLAPKSEPAPDVSIDEVHGTYISQLNILLKDRPDIKWSLVSKGSSQTRVAYTDTRKDYRITSPQDLVAQSAGLTESQELSICIIENISTEYVEAIGTAWGIDPMFFVAHATNPERDRLWSRKWDWSAPDYTSCEDRDESDEDSSISAPSILDGISGHLSGVFEYHNVNPNLKSSDFEKLDSSPNFIYRHCFKDEKWPLQSNTRISYCRPNKWMYLFLIDAPLKLPSTILDKRTRSPPTLRFMNSVSRGGVEVPRLYQVSENDYCLFENLKMFCQHGWHFGFIFDERELTKGRYVVDDSENVLPCHPMIYLLASSLWEDNLRYLDQEIKRISFKEIRNPKLEINLELHDRREDLAHIRRGLVETKMYIPPSVARFFSEHPRRPYSSRIQADNWNRLLEECTRLEAFLMETFQLFMSSVSVQDSRLSINQSRRGSQLTLLALIYVPLSFVTGIFGMNIQQVNGSGLNLWVCFVTLVPVILVTILVFLAVKIYGDRKEAGENSSYSSKV